MNKIKYPRTKHFPWSRGYSDDDKVLDNCDHFIGQEIVVTEKYDGENSTLASDYYHARSLDSRDHESRSWIKAFHSSIKSNIPEGWRICGENLFAKHSIFYDSLKSYFYGFSIWDKNNICLSWDDTLDWFNLIGVTPVSTLWRGDWNEESIRNITLDVERQEGYVARVAGSFHYRDFGRSVAKFVRKNHVKTDSHWMFSSIQKNKLK